MKRTEVLQRLTRQREKLGDFKVKSLAIFGSVARDEAKPESDVDVLVEFEGPATFDRYIGVKTFLEDLLGCRVDLLTRKGIRPELMPYVEREAVHVS